MQLLSKSKITIVLLSLAIIALSVLVIHMNALSETRTPDKNFGTTDIRLQNGTEVIVYLADTEQKRSQGLMGVTHLKGKEGMVFVFDRKEEVQFYNKHTLLNLDLVWIREGKVVGISSLGKFQGEIEYSKSPGPVDAVWELETGRVKELNINEGDSILIN